MRHYSGGSLHGSLFSGGATLSGMGDWWDDLVGSGTTSTSSGDDGAAQPSSNFGCGADQYLDAQTGICVNIGEKAPSGQPGPDVHSPGAVPNIDGCAAEFGYQVDPKNSSYCILTAAAKKASAACKWDEYYDTFTNNCTKNPELVPVPGKEQACPAGTYKPFGSSTCIKTPAPKPTGGGGVTKTPTTTTVTPAPPVQQAGIFGISPFAIGLGLLVAVGGAVYYRRKKKAGGFKKNWHDDEDDFADASGWELGNVSYQGFGIWSVECLSRDPETGECRPFSFQCPDGQARSSETGLCVSAMSPGERSKFLSPCPDGSTRDPETGECYFSKGWSSAFVAIPGSEIFPGTISPLPAPPPGTVYVPQPDGTVATVPVSHLATPPPPGQFIVPQPACNAWREWDAASGACRVKPLVLVGGALLLGALAYTFL